MVAAVARSKQFKMASILAATCTLDIKRTVYSKQNIFYSSCKIKIQEMKKKDIKLFGLTED